MYRSDAILTSDLQVSLACTILVPNLTCYLMLLERATCVCPTPTDTPSVSCIVDALAGTPVLGVHKHIHTFQLSSNVIGYLCIAFLAKRPWNSTAKGCVSHARYKSPEPVARMLMYASMGLARLDCPPPWSSLAA